MRDIDTDISNAPKPDDVKIITNVVKLVQQLLRDHIEDIPSRKSDAWNWPLARLRRGPPLMNKWYFFYGLLDCYAQLARHLRCQDMPSDILAWLKRLLELSEFEEFRWKVIEILQACSPEKGAMDDWLESLHLTANIEEPRAVLSAVTSILEDNPTSPRADGFEARRTNVLVSTDADEQATYLSLVGAQVTCAADGIEIRRTDESLSSVSAGEQTSGSSLAEAQLSYTSEKHEAESAPYVERELSRWHQDGGAQVEHLLPSRGLFKKGFTQAGLSPDCSLAFFYNASRICVYRVITADKTKPQGDLVFERKFDKDSQISEVSLSTTMLAVSTRLNLELYRLDSRSTSPRPVKVIHHGDWDPSGVAIHERIFALGYRRGTQNSCEGRVVVHQIELCREGTLQVKEVLLYTLLMADMPKSLRFHNEGTYLTVITNTQNSILIWRIRNGVPTDHSPISIRKYHHRPV